MESSIIYQKSKTRLKFADSKSYLEEILHRCIHCGMCLPVCPTYNLTFQEQSSPRGRIRLMKSVHDGAIPVSDVFVDEMYFCLDCQACQTACPAGVHYGELVEDARVFIDKQRRDPPLIRWVKLLFLNWIVSSNVHLKFAARCLRVYNTSGLRQAVEQSGILKIFSLRLHEKHMALPKISEEFFDETVPEVIVPSTSPRGTVAFLSGCLMNVMFTGIHRDCMNVLQANNWRIVIPKEQVCCGSMHGHNGDRETARNLARKNIDVFEQYQFEILVLNSAGCCAFMKQYDTLLSDDPVYASRAEEFSKKTMEITEFLSQYGFQRPAVPIRKRVTYHEACHLVHTQKISSQPRELIQAIPGIEFVELPEATWCCGSAGIYNLLRYDDSMKVLERKINNIIATKPDIVTTANPGCHYQLECGIKKHGLQIKVMHPVSLLAQAYRAQT
jgi:glycolate oxidase iron-sulfur subunit